MSLNNAAEEKEYDKCNTIPHLVEYDLQRLMHIELQLVLALRIL